ncbi:MAG: hypothetical protein HJJLKODD_01160 [Phycisphaerae bacterium]|nr:hypothetical protein [Phycisphaerae bacterium]
MKPSNPDLTSITWPLAQQPSSRYDWLAIIFLTLLAGLIRWSSIDELSLWIDEIRQVTYYYAQSWREVMYLAAMQQQPPLDYWIGYLVFQFGQSDALARLPACLFGTLLIPVTWLVARQYLSRGWAAAAALLLVWWPFGIHYSREARPYAIFWFLLMLMLLALQRAWRMNRWRDWLIAGLVAALFLQTRGLEPLMIVAGWGVWSLVQLYHARRKLRPFFWKQLWCEPAARALGVLGAALIPFAYVFENILRQEKHYPMLTHDAVQGLNWITNLHQAGEMLASLYAAAQPFGMALIVLALAGGWIIYTRTDKPTSFNDAPVEACGSLKNDMHFNMTAEPIRLLLFMPLAIGSALHVVVYTLMVDSFAPKSVYLAYPIPVMVILTMAAGQRGSAYLAKRWPSFTPRLQPLLIGCVLTASLFSQINFSTAGWIPPKEDWRGAARIIQKNFDPQQDIVFAMVPSLWERGVVFRFNPHYLPTVDHLLDLNRHQQALYNQGQPIGQRRDCRVGLVAWYPADFAVQQLQARMVSRSDGLFEMYTLDQFFVLVSRERFPTADEGLLALYETLQQALPDAPERLVDIESAVAIIHAKAGRLPQAREHYNHARAQLPEILIPLFDRYHAELRPLFEVQPRLTAGPSDDQ